VTTAQILEHVIRSNAPTAVTATIERLSDREWTSIEGAAAAAFWQQTVEAPVSRTRRLSHRCWVQARTCG